MTDLADLVKIYKAAQQTYIEAETRMDLADSALCVARTRHENATKNLVLAGDDLRAAGRMLKEAGMTNDKELCGALSLARTA